MCGGKLSLSMPLVVLHSTWNPKHIGTARACGRREIFPLKPLPPSPRRSKILGVSEEKFTSSENNKDGGRKIQRRHHWLWLEREDLPYPFCQCRVGFQSVCYCAEESQAR